MLCYVDEYRIVCWRMLKDYESHLLIKEHWTLTIRGREVTKHRQIISFHFNRRYAVIVLNSKFEDKLKTIQNGL